MAFWCNDIKETLKTNKWKKTTAHYLIKFLFIFLVLQVRFKSLLVYCNFLHSIFQTRANMKNILVLFYYSIYWVWLHHNYCTDETKSNSLVKLSFLLKALLCDSHQILLQLYNSGCGLLQCPLHLLLLLLKGLGWLLHLLWDKQQNQKWLHMSARWFL